MIDFVFFELDPSLDPENPCEIRKDFAGTASKVPVAACGTMVDPIALIVRLDEIANHLLVVEPRFEKYGYDAKCRLVHHLDEFAAAHLPKCDLKTYFNDEIVCFIDRVLPKPFDPVEIMQQILSRGSHSSDDSTVEFVLKHESDLLMIDTTEIFSAVHRKQNIVPRNVSIPFGCMCAHYSRRISFFHGIRNSC